MHSCAWSCTVVCTVVYGRVFVTHDAWECVMTYIVPVQALALVARTYLDIKRPILIVTLTSSIYQWDEEIAKKLNNAKVTSFRVKSITIN